VWSICFICSRLFEQEGLGSSPAFWKVPRLPGSLGSVLQICHWTGQCLNFQIPELLMSIARNLWFSSTTHTSCSSSFCGAEVWTQGFVLAG
jgi:hypothetical protein